MCAPTVNYTRQNCGIATETFAFKCDKSISVATTNPHQQNPCMISGIIFVTIPYCNIIKFTIYCIRNSLLYVPIR